MQSESIVRRLPYPNPEMLSILRLRRGAIEQVRDWLNWAIAQTADLQKVLIS